MALRARVAELSVEDALHLSEDGALLVGGYQDGLGPVVLLDADGDRGHVADGEIDGRKTMTRSELEQRVGEAEGQSQEASPTTPWLVIEHPELSDADEARHLHDRPFERLMRLLRPEWNDVWLILIFAFFAGVLNLSTPIAVEALVNTVAFGRLLQPVVILATILFAFLAFAAVMKAMQSYVAEIIQRRLFTRISADLAYRLPRVDHSRLGATYAPELVNRFLDVVTLQKVVASLLLDGVSIVLATLVGMTVLAFYHPWLLGFDVLLLALVSTGLYVLGRGAVSSGITESKMKYKLTSWYEDIVRCEVGFKTGGEEFAIDRANQITAGYLNARRSHFTILFRQIVFVLALQAIAGTILLGAGGWLVIQGQLSLGQLVAAELIVTTILASVAKLGKHLEGFYDALASIDKLGVLFDLQIERHDGVMSLSAGGRDGSRVHAKGPAAVSFVKLGLPGVSGKPLSDHVVPGERVAIAGPSGSGKSQLMRVLYGLSSAASGHVEIDGADPSDVRPDLLRITIGLAGDPETFEGTIADNVRVGRPDVSTADARWALEEVGLLDDVLRLPDGIDTKINASGMPLSSTQLRLLSLARGMAGRPSLLLVDSLIDGLPDADADRIVAALCRPVHEWTLLVATGRRDIADRFDRTLSLN